MINEYKTYVPKFVYIPLTDPEYKICNPQVEVDQKVKAGQVLGNKYKGSKKLPVVSSVSGTVVEFKELQDRFGKTVDHVVIENDNEYISVELPAYENPTASQIRSRLFDLGIEHVNVDGSYTPLVFDKPIKHVVVNAAFTNEPFIKTDYLYVHENAQVIARGIELIGRAANAETITVIANKSMEPFAYNSLGEAIVDKNIQFETVQLDKVNGADIKVIQKIIQKPASPNLLDDGVLYIKVDTAKIVHDAVVLGKVPSSRQVCITGDGVKENVIYDVVVGTLLSDIVEDLGGYNEVDEMVLHLGNFLTGSQLTTDQTSITLNVDTINFQEFDEFEEDVCTKCGECNDICPVGILPQNIMDAEIRSVNERIVDLDTLACIECGLCTYTCPSQINVLEWVRRAKRRVK